MKRQKIPLPANQVKLFRQLRLFIAWLWGVSVTGQLRSLIDTLERNSPPRCSLEWRSSTPPDHLTIQPCREFAFWSSQKNQEKCYLVTNVRSVLAHNCYKMSNSGSKDRGRLKARWERISLVKGGKNGPSYISWKNPSKAELIRRVSFSTEPIERVCMPSKGKFISKKKSHCSLWIEIKGVALARKGASQSLYRVLI